MASSLACPKEVAAAVAHEPVSLEWVYRQHFGAVWRLLKRLGVADAQLDDAAQDVFLVVHRKLDGFDFRVPLKSWIFSIAVRVASEYRRRASRRRTEALDEGIPDGSASPARQVELLDSVRLLHELLGELNEKLRTVFVLSELEELRVPEIAEVLGVNLNTVYTRLRTARKRFEAALIRRQRSAGSAGGP